eukprot:jgi/Chlat1/8046/Chrsp73S07514
MAGDHGRRRRSASPDSPLPRSKHGKHEEPEDHNARHKLNEKDNDKVMEGDHDRERDNRRDRDRSRDVGRRKDSGRDSGRDGDNERGRESGRGREREGDVGSEWDGARAGERDRQRGRSRDGGDDGKASERSGRKQASFMRANTEATLKRSRTGGSPRRRRDSEISEDEGPASRHAIRHVADTAQQTDDSLARMDAAAKALEEKSKPTFELSGALAKETNSIKGVALVYTEPPEARKPSVRWRLYVFKENEPLKDPLYIHRQSCYLFGRERRVADVPTDHPSCSKQHAVLQYRLTESENDDGMMVKRIKPYVIDLGSTNGTFLNGERVEVQRYYELMEKDTLRFGNSSREYVLLHENSSS